MILTQKLSGILLGQITDTRLSLQVGDKIRNLRNYGNGAPKDFEFQTKDGMWIKGSTFNEIHVEKT